MKVVNGGRIETKPNKSLISNGIDVACNDDVTLNLSASKADDHMACIDLVMTCQTQLASNAFYTVAHIVQPQYVPRQAVRGTTVFNNGNVGFTQITETGLIQVCPLGTDYIPDTPITIDMTYIR